MSDLEFNNRILVLGYTGSGKSELINDLFGHFAGGAQRLLVDTKGEFSLPDPQHPGRALTPFDDVRDADWSAPLLHYKRPSPSPEEIEKLFKVLKRRRRLLTCVHELSDLCDYSANKTPPSVNTYLSQGRALGLGLIGGTQRPVNVPTRAFTDIDHAFIFAGGFPKKADMEMAAESAGLSSHELARLLRELLQKMGKHAFVHADRADGTITPHAPLSETERGGIIVGRPQLY